MRSVAIRCEVVEQQERVCLAPAKLRRHIEDGGGFGFDARQTPQCLNGKPREALGEEGSLEESRRVLIDLRRAIVSYLVEMHREFGSIERFIVPQVLPRRSDLIPRLQWHSEPRFVPVIVIACNIRSRALSFAPARRRSIAFRQYASDIRQKEPGTNSRSA